MKEIRLASNVIGDEGAAAFAEVLQANMTLVSVDLRDNPIGDKEGDDRDPIDILLTGNVTQIVAVLHYTCVLFRALRLSRPSQIG